MKLTILGNCGGFPKADGACSGYLLESDTDKFVLDMGAGTFSHLLSLCSIEDISAVFLSHLHWDHISDLMVFRYALEAKKMKMKVFAPAEPKQEFDLINSISVFDVTPITDDLETEIGGIHFFFSEMSHPFKDFAIKADDGRKPFVYTGDTCVCDNLIPFMTGCWTVLCDSTFIKNIESDKHLNVFQATEAAKEAGVRHLILTHFDPNIRNQKYFIAAHDLFPGRLTPAEIMQVINI